MERQTSTKKSQTHAGEIDAAVATFVAKAPELDFPVDRDFASQPPHLDPVAMYWRCEELMRQSVRNHDFQRRSAEIIEVEFTM